MNLQPQMLIDTLVAQHAGMFAQLHADLEEAVLEVATRWSDRFPVPSDMCGTTRCVSVRQTLLSMNDVRGQGSGASLSTSQGVGMSVVLTDRSGRRIRVRKYPTDHLGERIRTVQVPPPGQREAAAAAVQLALDEGFEEPLFVEQMDMDCAYDLFVLWWLDVEQIGLKGAVLAAVANIDDGAMVRILATAELPPPAYGTSLGPISTPPTGPAGDFDEFEDASSGTGTDPDITPA